jgi:hypothetical protein
MVNDQPTGRYLSHNGEGFLGVLLPGSPKPGGMGRAVIRRD